MANKNLHIRAIASYFLIPFPFGLKIFFIKNTTQFFHLIHNLSDRATDTVEYKWVATESRWPILHFLTLVLSSSETTNKFSKPKQTYYECAKKQKFKANRSLGSKIESETLESGKIVGTWSIRYQRILHKNLKRWENLPKLTLAQTGDFWGKGMPS